MLVGPADTCTMLYLEPGFCLTSAWYCVFYGVDEGYIIDT